MSNRKGSIIFSPHSTDGFKSTKISIYWVLAVGQALYKKIQAYPRKRNKIKTRMSLRTWLSQGCERRRWSWTTQMGPMQSQVTWEDRHMNVKTNREGNVQMEQRDAATSQGILTGTRSRKGQGRPSPQGPEREYGPADTFISIQWNRLQTQASRTFREYISVF